MRMICEKPGAENICTKDCTGWSHQLKELSKIKRKNVKERDMEEKYEADLFGKPGGVLIKLSDLANQTKWLI